MMVIFMEPAEFQMKPNTYTLFLFVSKYQRSVLHIYDPISYCKSFDVAATAFYTKVMMFTFVHYTSSMCVEAVNLTLIHNTILSKKGLGFVLQHGATFIECQCF